MTINLPLPSVARCAAIFIVGFLLSAQVAHAAFDASLYANNKWVRAGSIRFYWSITGSDATRAIKFALEVNVASSSTGAWVGFGVGEETSGSMPGADIMIAGIPSTSTANPTLTIGDYYATGLTMPLLDNASAPLQANDWVGVAFSQNTTAVVVEASRLLNVTDAFTDRAIVDNGNPTNLIFAFGQGSSVSYHGSNRAMVAIDLFTPNVDRLAALRADPNVTVVRWQRVNYRVPAQVTTYVKEVCFDVPSLLGGTPYIVAFAPFVTPGNEAYVHHMVLKGYVDGGSGCVGSRNSVDLLAVASRQTPLVFPSNVGMDMTKYKAFTIETHFDNPLKLSTIVDSSGVDVFYTRTARQYNAGVLQLGDPAVFTGGTLPLDQGFPTYNYECPGYCSAQWSADITVFGSLLHMHKYGRQMETRVYRGDALVRTTKSEYYSFGMQQTVLNTPYTIQRGDRVVTTCTYQKGGDNQTRFGQGSSDEMCIDFVYHYPALSFPYCGYLMCGSYTGVSTIADEANLGPAFGRRPIAVQAAPLTPPAVSATTTAPPRLGGGAGLGAAAVMLAAMVALSIY